MKQKLIIIFDLLQSFEAGGLVNMYRQLITLLKNEYEIEIISAFDSGKNEFTGRPVTNIFPFKTDVNLTGMKKALFSGHLIKAAKVPVSVALYVGARNYIQKKIGKILDQNKNSLVIAVSPAAANFIPAGYPFILEIHTKYEYFFQGPFVAREQIKRMTNPELTLFRTKRDALLAPQSLHPDYVYNFIDFDNAERTNRRSTESTVPKIIYMGRLEKEKDPVRLIECASLLHKKGCSFQLDIYGTGSLETDLRKAIENFGLQNIVRLKGFTNDKSVYQNYSLIWMTSKYEGLPLTVIEGKYFGVPVVSTRWEGGIEELIKDGIDGYIADSNEELVEITDRLFQDEDELKRVSDNARADFNRFSPETAKSRWIQILEDFTDQFNLH